MSNKIIKVVYFTRMKVEEIKQEHGEDCVFKFQL